MAFLILLIIATAILFAWLLVSVTRTTLGELHLPRLHPSPARPPVAEPRPESTPLVPEPRVDPEVEAELAVREHLYGRPNRSR